MARTPHITEADIRALVSSKISDRGFNYYRNGHIEKPRQQGNKIWARCYGSESYELGLTLGEHRILESHCSCPYDWGPYCKHRIALLLQYVHAPDSFVAIAPIEELLADYNRDDLVVLIERFVNADPDLLELLPLNPATATMEASSTPSFNVKRFAMEARQAFLEDDIYLIERRLNYLSSYPKTSLTSGNYLEAGMLYHALIDAFDSKYNQELFQDDYDGDLIYLLNDYIEKIGTCLLLEGQSVPANERLKWLETLLQVFFRDLEFGGVEYGDEATVILKKCSNETEWNEIEQHCLKLLPYSEKWERERLVDFVGDRLSTQNKASLILENGSPQQKIDVLVQQKEYIKAQQIALESFTYELVSIVKLADIFVQAREDQLALAMMQKFQGRAKHSRYQAEYSRWVTKYYQQHQDLKAAIKAGKNTVLLSHDLQDYILLRKILKQSGEWESIKPLILEKFTQEKLFPLLMAIALEEKDLERALQLSVTLKQQSINYFDRTSHYKNLAQLAKEQQQYSVAIALYRELADGEIAQKKRKHYKVAAKYLKQVKRTFQMQNDIQAWETYLAEFKEKYRRSPALLDECKKAMLP